MIVLGRDRVQTATSYAYHARGRGAGGGSEGDLTDVHTDYIMGPCPPRAPGGGKSDGQIYHMLLVSDKSPRQLGPRPSGGSRYDSVS